MQKYNFWFYYQIPIILYGITYYLLCGNLHKKGTDILGITNAYGKLRTIVISKRNPAPFEQQRVSVPIEEQEQKCLSVCAIRWWECVKRVLLFPRLERQTRAANDVRPSAHMLWHEQRTGVTCETCAGSFWCFLRSKSTLRKTWRKINNKSLKVKDCRKIKILRKY